MRAKPLVVDSADDATLIRDRISGQSVASIAKHRGVTQSDVLAALDRYAATSISDRTRRHNLALELARLDDLQTAYYEKAKGGDLQAAQLVAKLIERRCIILGLHTPQQAVVQIIEADAPPRPTNTDRIEAALNALLTDQRKNGSSGDGGGGGETPN